VIYILRRPEIIIWASLHVSLRCHRSLLWDRPLLRFIHPRFCSNWLEVLFLWFLSHLFVLEVFCTALVLFLLLINLLLEVVVWLVTFLEAFVIFSGELDLVKGIDRVCFEGIVRKLIIIYNLLLGAFSTVLFRNEIDISIISIIRCAEIEPSRALLLLLLWSHNLHFFFILGFIPKHRRTR